MTREAAHMKLVDHRLGEGSLQRQVAFTVVASGIGDDAFHRYRGIVAGPARGFAVIAFGERHGQTIRVEENFLAIEAKTSFRRERPWAR